MKKQLRNSILTLTLVLFAWNQSTNAQTLFKDMEPGNGVSSSPHQFTNVNGTVYFITDPSLSRRHALWRTDGTLANTVMVKDSILNTNISDRLLIRGYTGDTLYYTVNQNVQADTTTELWMVKNGSLPVLVTTLTSRMVNQYSNGEPRLYKMAGGKLYFQMYTDHGYELWVSNGTAAGTYEISDLFPGTNSGIINGGASPVAMGEYNGKIYFQGLTAYDGVKGLYSSDGTPGNITLIKEGPGFDPENFTVYNNELYFLAKSGTQGLWKTNGTTIGTVNINNVGFSDDPRIFKNDMYFSVGSKMFKTSISGTTSFMDSLGTIIGMNNSYFFTRYMRTFSTPPYFEYYYWRSDGTTGGTSRVADSIANASSFAVLNNKMYSVATGTSLWESDGTEAGTKKLIDGNVNFPFILNNKVFFSNWGAGTTTGYELWSYTPATTTGIVESRISKTDLSVYPNPSDGHFTVNLSNIGSATASTIDVYNHIGENIYTQAVTTNQNNIDLSGLPAGIYFVKVDNGTTCYNQKIIIR